jgi:hypothetical protein
VKEEFCGRELTYPPLKQPTALTLLAKVARKTIRGIILAFWEENKVNVTEDDIWWKTTDKGVHITMRLDALKECNGRESNNGRFIFVF